MGWYTVGLQVYPISKLIIIKKIKKLLQMNVTGLYNCHVDVKS